MLYHVVVIVSLVWLDKQAAGRYDDSCDAGFPASATASKEDPSPYPQESAADNGNVSSITHNFCQPSGVAMRPHQGIHLRRPV